MKEALVSAGPKVQIVDSPIPKPKADEVLIKVVFSGSNPKDWKRADVNKEPWNTGDDIAGTVNAVGPKVQGFHPGDRVAAFHVMQEPHGSFAEYVIAPSHTTFHIPDHISLEEASTIPLAALTAADVLYQNLNLPLPFNPTSTPIPLIIYGASSAVGSFALQFARQSNIHPIIAIAGSGVPHVETLLDKSKGDEVLDYRVGSAELLIALKGAVGKSGGEAKHAFDAIAQKESYITVAQALSPGGKIALVSPGTDLSTIPEGIHAESTYVGTVHGQALLGPPRQEKTGTQVGDKEFGEVILVLIKRGLEKGWFKGQPYEVRGGLEAVEGALRDLKEGKVSAKKLIFRIGDTEGAGAD